MMERDRQRAIRGKLARVERRTRGCIPTGFAALDRALGGGLPRGGIVELFGPDSCGKTTLALQIAAQLEERGMAAAWIDADRTFDPAYASSLGVRVERLVVALPESEEEALDVARQLAASGAIDLVIVDSAAALVPRLELTAGIGAGGPGLQGRLLSSGLRGLSAALKRAGAAALFINQVRSRPDSPEDETATGGPALKLFASARVSLRPVGRAGVVFRIVKNRVASPFVEGELPWSGGLGLSKSP